MLVVDDLRGARKSCNSSRPAPLRRGGGPTLDRFQPPTGVSLIPSRVTTRAGPPISAGAWNWSLHVSKPIQVDDSHVLVFCGVELPADGTTLEAGRSAAEEIARTAQERLLMDELARRLLEETRVDAIDPGLKRAWETR